MRRAGRSVLGSRTLLRRMRGESEFELFKREGLTPPKNDKLYTCETNSDVRAVAEFDPMGGVLIGHCGLTSYDQDLTPQASPVGPYTFGIPNELIIKMMQSSDDEEKQCDIFIMTGELSGKTSLDDNMLRPNQLDNDSIFESLENTVNSNEHLEKYYNPDLIHFVPWSTDSYWTRDFGPWWVQDKKQKEKFGVVKHIYTTLGGGTVGMAAGKPKTYTSPADSGIFRPNDDYGAVYFIDYLMAPILKYNSIKPESEAPIDTFDWYFSGLLDVGGNYMTNGDGELASSYLVATQNTLVTDDNYDNRMKTITTQVNKFLGINKYQVLVDPSGTYIGHIDCWGKYLANDKILIAKSEDKKVNEGFDRIAKVFDDRQYHVSRVLCQELPELYDDKNKRKTTAAYTNSLILNKTVYMPIPELHNEKNIHCNNEALKAYSDALPDYDIIPVEPKPNYPWLGTDALHCRTRGIPRKVIKDWKFAMKRIKEIEQQ